ncbi:EAL domain-containing protein/glycosyl transferase [Halomicronema hongdechloris C2206]|uniref:4,4'-diaponeurosporenoate glycosyltransferase n=1 Tax=Halomicronema hongdechloris C2206 TaxID=1641165 RepID=A0A1Z3HK10_9CYAN|nr:TIGR04283 family arsenosugar biosynthesis glycosyltransferase [Halomicronema hongdechloris]ASC70417.1 EAL domain-containing protein/glycosyl transferase [Halomicronema hongdechloris C2206]
MQPNSVDAFPLTAADSSRPLISVIIPTLNEATNLPPLLKTVQAAAQVEVIVADGGSQDDTVAVARAAQVQVVASPPGRARQMNRGAAMARGKVLLFLHADTWLPQGFEQLVPATLTQPRVVAGAFELAIQGSGWGLRWVEWGVKLRSQLLQLPYGDQALFLRADRFRELGGFRDLPIMEDFELVRRLRRQGRIAMAPAAVLTSGRRWQTLGTCRTTLINQVMIGGYLLGIAPTTLGRWYRQQR